MRSIFLIIFLIVTLMIPWISEAQPMGKSRYHGPPYGHYCPGMQWGPYGVRKPVGSVEQARQLIDFYLKENGQSFRAGSIAEKDRYFEAEILNLGMKVIDRVIIDKRSGRIRSIY